MSIATTEAGAAPLAATALARTLDTAVTGKMVETQGNQYDDLHRAYIDENYWNFCAAGAAAVAAYYWRPEYVTTRPAEYYTEPYGPHKSTTYWRASDTGTASDTSNGYATKGRGYEMYMAMKVKPPSYSRPGIVNFDSYPTSGGGLIDIRDALNWELSGRDPATWNGVFAFYAVHQGAGTQSEFVNNVKNDVYYADSAVVVNLNTDKTIGGVRYRLPNWTHNVPHAITIVGFDDNTSRFIYTDTCGKRCNASAGNNNGGTYSVSYTTMFKLMQNLGYGYVW